MREGHSHWAVRGGRREQQVKIPRPLPSWLPNISVSNRCGLLSGQNTHTLKISTSHIEILALAAPVVGFKSLEETDNVRQNNNRHDYKLLIRLSTFMHDA